MSAACITPWAEAALELWYSCMDTLLLLGGGGCREAGGLQPLSDFFVLDTRALAWQYPKPAPGAAGPSPRNAATLTAVGSSLVLHGGWNPFVQSYNDTFVMDVSGYDQLRAEVPLEPEDA